MISGRLVHPPLLAALAATGHGEKVLVCDGHYPATTASGPRARHVHLNLSPGLLDTTTVLDVLLDVVPVEAAHVMVPPDGADSAAVTSHRARLGRAPVHALDRFAFYDTAKGDDVAVVVVTADVRQYANVLLTVGVLGVDAGDEGTGGEGAAA